MEKPARFLYGEIRSLSTPADSPDYVRASRLIRRSYMRTVGRSAGLPLDATTIWYLGSNVSFLRWFSSTDNESRRTVEDTKADGIDGIALECVFDGRYQLITPFGRTDLRAGGLGLIQSTTEFLGRTEQAKGATLFLPRARLIEEAGYDFLGSQYRIRDLSKAPLARFFFAQMRLLNDFCGQVAAETFENAIGFAAAVAVDMLRALHVAEADEPSSELFAKSLHYLQENLSRHALEPDDVARALGISRARLYREFKEHGLTETPHGTISLHANSE